MAVEVEKLVAVLEANVNKFTKELDRAGANANRAFTKIEKRGKQMESRMAGLGRNLSVGRGIFAAVAGSAALSQAQRLIDASTRIGNALKAAGLEGDEFRRVQDGLFASANRNAAPVESLAQLYSRLSLVQKELGVDSEQLLGFTDKVALALRAGGQSAGEASGALLQLSQALGSGIVRAEEFNSILEGAPAIAQAVAAGLEEAGGSVAKLRQLVVDGEISSKAFFAAFEAGSVILQERVAGASLTVEQSLQQVNNALIHAAGRLDEATGASRGAADMLGHLAGVIEGLSNVFAAAADGPIGTFIGKLGQLNDLVLSILPGLSSMQLLSEDSLNGIAKSIGSIGGGSGRGGRVAPGGISQETIQNRIDQASGSAGATSVRTVSIRGYPVSGLKRPGGGGGGGGGRSSVSRASEYEREVAALKERIAALDAESAALAGINPLQENYSIQLEKARIAHELLTAAKASGLAITPQLRAQIDSLAEGYAQASANAEGLARAQDDAAASARELSGLAKDVMSGFISDLRAGKSGAEALAGALDKVADKLLDIVLSSLFDGIGGGLLGGLFGFSSGGYVRGFARGGYTGSGGRLEPAGVVHRGEYVVNAAATQRVGRAALDRINRGYADGGFVGGGSGAPGGAQSIHVTVGVSSDNNGNLLPFVQSVSQMTAAAVVNRASPAIVHASVGATQQALRNRPGFAR